MRRHRLPRADGIDRAKNMCISIAREFGEVSAFSAGDRVFTADELAACNGNKKEVIAKN